MRAGGRRAVAAGFGTKPVFSGAGGCRDLGDVLCLGFRARTQKSRNLARVHDLVIGGQHCFPKNGNTLFHFWENNSSVLSC